jgi:hypothetical protein
MTDNVHFILLHKQNTSSRLRFFCLPHGVLAFTSLPADLQVNQISSLETGLTAGHAALVNAEQQLKLPPLSLEPVDDFQVVLSTNQGDISIFVAAFTSIDPPFEAADELGGRFIAMTEARQLSDLDRNLLRLVYEHVLG